LPQANLPDCFVSSGTYIPFLVVDVDAAGLSVSIINFAPGMHSCEHPSSNCNTDCFFKDSKNRIGKVMLIADFFPEAINGFLIVVAAKYGGTGNEYVNASGGYVSDGFVVDAPVNLNQRI